MLLAASSFLGAAVLLATTVGLALPRRRLQSVIVGSAGLLAGGIAVLVYTIYHYAMGVPLDLIPHERAAVWLVSAYGWAGLATWLVTALHPRLRGRLDRQFPAVGRRSDDESRPTRLRRVL